MSVTLELSTVCDFGVIYCLYPQCLYLLDLLQYEVFRKELVNTQCAKFIDDQQLLHWQHYQRKRTKLINNEHEKHQSQPSQGQQTSATSNSASGSINK
ncbi:MED31 [Bugula neritina]|uniref:Mediator of RNA polymerase II transcription subunit 31 n=1 Tax=Bugula neritina TaxID=10212 RepID=A0A7J7K7N8_BUGNE|nr:MED31 [Bugula neritina]